jgi:hypothetical protein
MLMPTESMKDAAVSVEFRCNTVLDVASKEEVEAEFIAPLDRDYAMTYS